MLQLSASEKLTGQCPNCGWCPPPQNAFRPNIMNEYFDTVKKQIVVLSESADRVESERGVFLRYRDDNGHIIKRTTSNPPPAPVISAAPVSANTPTILAAREIPASMIKTPEEAAKTPKASVTPASVAEPIPTMSNPAAPAQTPEAKQP